MKKVYLIPVIGLCIVLGVAAQILTNLRIVPAQLELQWERNLSYSDLNTKQVELADDMAKQLQQIGDYRLSQTIHHKDKQAKVSFHLRFAKGFSHQELSALIPQFRAIFHHVPLQITFKEQYQKRGFELFDGIFLRYETPKAIFRIKLDDTSHFDKKSQDAINSHST